MPRKKAETIVKTESKPVAAKEPKKDYIYAVGRRKTSVARIRLFKNGEGKITVNNKGLNQYFAYFEWQNIVTSPLSALGKANDYDFQVRVKGGGIHSQAEAVRTGISNSLLKIDPAFRKTLKPLGFLTRDPRQKERKKPGLKRARRAPQWQKR